MKDIFCANCQEVTAHKGVIDGNGEFVFTCQTEGCERFLKFAADTTPQSFNELLVIHQEVNTGQVSVAVQEAKLAELLGETPEPAAPDTNPPAEGS